MIPLLLIFLSALLFAIGGTPVVRHVAVALGIVDHPGARKTHQRAMPLLGGLAIYAAFVAALALFSSEFYVEQVIGILLGATWVSFLGVWDDWRGMRPLFKLAGQVLAALILIATGVRVEFLHQPVLDLAVTIFWVVGITNALNLLDNMDGLSGGVAAIAATWFAVFALAHGQVLVASLALALLGASLGFLVYNFNPASIFMGDTGSLFLGFLLAAVGIKLRFLEQTDRITWMIPILVLGVPIFDTTLVVISRLRRGVNPLTTPGRDHFSHRLNNLGLTPRRAVLVIYLLGVLLGALASALPFATVEQAFLLFVIVTASALLALTWLERNGSVSHRAAETFTLE